MFRWRWHYHFPTLPLWGVILLLLVAPKANRNRQAWLILIPLVFVLLVWRMPARLFSIPDGSTDYLGFIVVSPAMAWTMVWLLGHWLAFGNRIVTSMAIVAVMAAVGPFSLYSQSDHSDVAVSLLIYHGICVLVFVLGMMFATRRCRRRCSPGRLCGWLFMADCVTAFMCLLALGILLAVCLGPGLRFVGELVLQIAVVAPVVGTILFLVNLPFLILAFQSPFYRERLERIFGVASAEQSEAGQEVLVAETADDVGCGDEHVDRVGETERREPTPEDAE